MLSGSFKERAYSFKLCTTEVAWVCHIPQVYQEILNRFLEQIGETTYYLTRDAAVVLNKAGEVVTAYSKNEFLPKVTNLLLVIK